MSDDVKAMNDWNAQIMAEFRANGGKCGGQFAGAEMMILHTTGARTGAHREHPLCCLPDGDRIVVFASKAGAPTSPDWYHNLVANPEVEVEYGTERYRARAVEATGAERDALYARQVAALPQFDAYRHSTTRVIPVVVLERL